MRQEYSEECFPILRDFLGYMEVVKAGQSGTVENYFADLRVFFRYISNRGRISGRHAGGRDPDSDIDIDPSSVPITLQDIYEYMSYAKNERRTTTKRWRGSSFWGVFSVT